MNDAGFLAKSNFYREFRRLKGCSPTQWREEH
ncbi:MAG: AraC-like DNA-binding protein [Granulosicoccus sp.]|jgi:AraC-like DNA-binding protein